MSYPSFHRGFGRQNQLKVMLKAKIVQILFLQIHQNYAKYTFKTFTVDIIAIAYQIESIA